MSEAALKKAIGLAGGPGVIARSLGISSAAVSQWLTCPPLRVLSIETLSGVPRHDLRPDLYPPPISSANLPQVASAHA